MGIGFGTFGTFFAFPGGERVAAVHLMFFARKNEISFGNRYFMVQKNV